LNEALVKTPLPASALGSTANLSAVPVSQFARGSFREISSSNKSRGSSNALNEALVKTLLSASVIGSTEKLISTTRSQFAGENESGNPKGNSSSRIHTSLSYVQQPTANAGSESNAISSNLENKFTVIDKDPPQHQVVQNRSPLKYTSVPLPESAFNSFIDLNHVEVHKGTFLLVY
jgi:hypothetical protein